MKKLLVVEDDPVFRGAVGATLRALGYKVTEAPDGRIAREICMMQGFDLILSDVQMPYLNGIEFLKWVKSNLKTPFVIMTGYTNILETKGARELGADSFLAKPFRNHELQKVLKEVFFHGANKDQVSSNVG